MALRRDLLCADRASTGDGVCLVTQAALQLEAICTLFAVLGERHKHHAGLHDQLHVFLTLSTIPDGAVHLASKGQHERHSCTTSCTWSGSIWTPY